MARKLLPFGGPNTTGKKGFQKKRFAQIPTRLQLQAQNNLGIIMVDAMSSDKTRKVRSDDLDLFDQYYENRQYDTLPEWDKANATDGTYIPVRQRAPRIKYNLPMVLVDKVAGKITGKSVFPKFVVEEDAEDTDFFRVVQNACGFRRNLVDPMKKLMISGSVFVRFQIKDGTPIMEGYNSKYCYPKFDATGELEQIEIRYVYEDGEDKDAKGNPKKKWYRLVLTKTSDTLFDNPDYREGSVPQFKVVNTYAHNLGWVQGEWFRTSKEKFSPDGQSILAPILDFFDEFNYSLSQTSQAVGYNQDPQLVVNNIDEDELDKLIRSATKAWNMGREGKAEFIQSDLAGVTVARETRDDMRQRALEVVRVIMHDPEKIVGNASSGKALEILFAPLLELVDELRTVIEPSLKNLIIKIGMTLLALNAEGFETILTTPDGYEPQSLDVTVKWPPIFPPTLEDLQKMATTANTLSMANLVSRETLTRWLAPHFDIEDVDEELKKILSQPPPPNPFGGGMF
jgi:hypothetical protein